MTQIPSLTTVKKHYESIEAKCDAILAAQNRWHTSPFFVALAVIGAFVLAHWLAG